MVLLGATARAEPPGASYIFPAGGQRGTKVQVNVGGHYLHDQADFEVLGPGVSGPAVIRRTETLWFEGPLIKLPASQQAEDYPQDYAAEIAVADDAPLGTRYWRVWNAQGITSALRFIVGDLPEIVEEEIEGDPIPVSVSLPVTINGRIFPREDIDVWSFEASAGQSVTCSVAAAQFGSPLLSRLEIRDPAGRPIAETTGDALGRVQLRFTPTESGRHEVHIHDLQAGGLQHYVYRLTITSGPWFDSLYPLGGRRGSELELHALGQGIASSALTVKLPDAVGICSVKPETSAGTAAVDQVVLDIDDLPEQLEAEPNQEPANASALPVPAVANGRIDEPGDSDLWKLLLSKGQSVHVSLRAGQLGSPLAGVVTVRDAAGKELASAAWLDQQKDGELTLIAPDDGEYFAQVREQFPRRGGPEFAYRLRIAAPQPDFELLLPVDSLAVDIGDAKNLEVKVVRRAGFNVPIVLHAEALPAGVTCDDVTVAENGDKGVLVFKATENVPVMSAIICVVGRAARDGQSIERGARFPTRRGEPPLDALRLVTTLKTPFKFAAAYEFCYTPRGATLKKRYTIDRGGYEGPLVAQLADRQGRHLQGVTGPVVNIAASASEFEYALRLAPWMELGRTSRTNLMLTGEVRDAAGNAHKVCFTTRDQNEQMIALISPSLLRIVSERSSLLVEPDNTVVIPVQIKRDRSITSPIRLEVSLPRHIRDVFADSVEVPPEAASVDFPIRFGPAPGPLNAPLTIRATGERSGGPVTAELQLEAVLSGPK